MRRRTVCALGGLVTLVSRREDLMPLRGSYLSLVRQVDELERRAQTVRWGAGCPTCVGWPAYPLRLAPEVAAVEAQWEDGAAGRGDPASRARGGWPEAFVCPGCGREPETVIALAYVDTAPPEVHLPGWRPGDTS